MDIDGLVADSDSHSPVPVQGRSDGKLTWPGNAGLDGLDGIVASVARHCGGAEVLILWHPPAGETQILGSLRAPASARCVAALNHASMAAASMNRSSHPAAHMRIFAEEAIETAAMVVAGGIVTVTVLYTAPDRKMAERQPAFENAILFVAAFFRQWAATQAALARVGSLSQAVEYSGTATVLLSDGAKIIHANSAAECILAEQDGLRRNGERLACASFADTLRIQAAIGHLHAQAAQEAGLTPVLAVPRPHRRPLTIALTAARAGSGMFEDEVRAIAYVFDPEEDLTNVLEPACRLHGLSSSETKLTCALVAGTSLCVAAQRLGIQEQTARSYLKHIFAKTETNRQAELVQLMLKSAVRLSVGGRTQAFL